MKLNVTDYKVLEEIRINNRISRIQLANMIGITPAAITKIINKLLGLNLIFNNNILESKGGRPEKSLKINHKYKKIVGVNFGPEFIETSLSYLDGEIIAVQRRNFYLRNQEKILRILFEEVEKILSGYDMTEILGLGLALHGTANKEKGISVFSPHFGWKDFEIQKLLEKRYGIKVVLDNDVRAMAIAEHEFGRGQDTDDFFMLHISNGVGGAIFLNGSTYEGINYSAGEIGHMIIKENSNIRCSCGKYGCLETEVSDEAIKSKVLYEMEKLGMEPDRSIKMDEIYNLGRQKKEPFYSVIKESSYETGKILGNVLNILNIKLVVVAGKITDSGPVFFKFLEKGVKKTVLSGLENELVMVPSKFYDLIGIYGALSLITTNLFKDRKLIG